MTQLRSGHCLVGAAAASLLLLLLALACHQPVQAYQIGTGIADITGPAAEVGFMGYAMMKQKGNGLHLRLRARAFVLSDGSKRIAFVNTDICMMWYEVKHAVVNQLAAKLGQGVYDFDNIMLSSTHTHSGPGGFAYHALYDLTTEGFNAENFNMIVNGIYNAILTAHTNCEASSANGKILINSGTLNDSNINRSPTAYLANPAEERASYPDGNTDKLMTVLRMMNGDGDDVAMLNWFAVHGTSMYHNNTLISGDNKGYASYLFEKWMNGNTSLPGTGPFIAAFGQSNEGDVSPRTGGAFCPDGTPCVDSSSTCGGKNEGCNGVGPSPDDFESTRIIGTNQATFAMSLFEAATTALDGPIDFRHMFVDMSSVTVSANYSSTGQTEVTCPAAMGDSFAAGTTDGPGALNFFQGMNASTDDPFWNFIAHFLSKPSAQQIACQAPKPILLNTGDITYPLPWTENIHPVQIFRIGQLFIIGAPGEFTTMSGRRLRNTVKQTLVQSGFPDTITVVIAGLSNSYSAYIATYEEYQYQRYEAASTMFGPHTLAAYQQSFATVAQAMASNAELPPGPTPTDWSNKTFTFLPPVVVDTAPLGKSFGDVATDVPGGSAFGVGDTVQATFWGADPRNEFEDVPTFLTVDRNVNGQWVVVATDGDWETKFSWQRSGVSESLVTVQWAVPNTVVSGTYRLHVFGRSKSILGTYTPYEGVSSAFTVSV